MKMMFFKQLISRNEEEKVEKRKDFYASATGSESSRNIRLNISILPERYNLNYDIIKAFDSAIFQHL